MNFMRTKIVVSEEGVFAVAGQFRLALPPARLAASPRLASYAGREVMMGVRPEALRPGSIDEKGALAGVVAFVEDFGATRLIHLDVEVAENLSEIATEPDEVALSRPRLRALISADEPVIAGERLVLTLEAERTHFFDLENENAIRD